MSIIWDTPFEASPAGGDSPALGDDKIREIKEAFRERFEHEHKMDLSTGTASLDGWHIQGSAISYIQADAPTQRPDGATVLSALDNGRIWIDTDDISLHVYIHGTGWVDLSAHDFIDQDVKTTASPSFAGITIDGNTFLSVPVVSHKLGTSLARANSSFPSMASMDSTHIAIHDFNTQTIITYIWDGEVWAILGNEYATGESGQGFLGEFDATHITYVDSVGGELKMLVWDGADWTVDGSVLTVHVGAGASSLCLLDSTHIAYVDDDNNELRTYVWSGTAWSQVGNALAVTAVVPKIAVLDSTTVAIVDSTDDTLITYTWDGVDWTLVSTFALEGAAITDIVGVTSKYIILLDSGIEKWETYYWNGSVWNKAGPVLPVVGIGGIAIAKLGTDKIAFIDTNSDDLTTYKIEYNLIGS